MFKKLIYFIVTAFLTLNIYVLAEEDSQKQQFTSNYEVSYKIATTGEVSIKQNIEIINNQQDVIATNYSLSIKQMDIFDVTANVNGQDVEPRIDTKDGQTTIKVNIKNPAIGKNKKSSIQIQYKTFDIASKIGEIWTINIPKTNLLKTTNKYDVTVRVPTTFGPQIYVSPTYTQTQLEADEAIYIFEKDNLLNSGITASFGNFQVLNFKLDYDLQNHSYFSTTKEIALPPDILGIQQVTYKNLTPAPQNLKQDTDGNTIAVYKLAGKENLNVRLIGTARILGKQIKPEYGASIQQIPKSLTDKYTKESEFWPINDNQIKEIVNVLFDPNESAAQNAQRAYFFTVNNLEYDFEILKKGLVERKGALRALSEDDSNACMEFTDLFITLVRAMGIPARQLNGYAIVNESEGNTKLPLSINLKGGDLLHSWAEFYDAEFGWVPVDPTWGSTSEVDYFTKLDTNHLVFSINGTRPDAPLPAGTYKLDENDKQVTVDFAQNVDSNDFELNLDFKKVASKNPFFILKGEHIFEITNNGFTTVYITTENKLIPLLPTQTIKRSIKSKERIKYKDTTQKEYSYTNEYEFDVKEKVYALTMIILVGLGLYMIFYVLTNHLKHQKRPLAHLHRLLRGQDQ